MSTTNLVTVTMTDVQAGLMITLLINAGSQFDEARAIFANHAPFKKRKLTRTDAEAILELLQQREAAEGEPIYRAVEQYGTSPPREAVHSKQVFHWSLVMALCEIFETTLGKGD